MTVEAQPRPDQPVATARPTAPPSMHALYLEAGGDTPQYDVDRYLGLLRDHGYARERVGLTEIVRTTILREAAASEADQVVDPSDRAEAFARILADELGKHGYRIHDIARCIRPADDPLTVGRPMTPEEEQQLVIDAPPARPRPTRRRPRSRS